MILTICTYTKPIEVIDELLVAHRKFTQDTCNQGKFIFTGPNKARTGGISVANVSLEEAQELAKKDPFYINDAAKYEFIEINPATYDDRFSCFIDK